jgi:cytochrome c-type protein NapB
MKNITLITGLITLLFAACAQQQVSAPKTTVADSQLGLSKTSVFDTPAPQPFSYTKSFPGTGTVLPRAYPGAPPQIPHSIEGFKPVTASNNACLACHHNPAMRGKKVAGMPTAIPESHYIDQRNNPGVVGEQIVGARYVCTQCHVPQADVAPLVDNTFKSE